MIAQLAIWLGRTLQIRGSGRVLSWLYPRGHGSKRYIQGVYRRADGLLMELDSRNWIDWSLLFRGEYEPQVTALLQRLAPVGGVVVDVGANIGAHTLTLARTLGENGTVLAFEPNPLVCPVLRRNIALNNFSHVQIYGCALGDMPGAVSLRIPTPVSAEYANMGLASLVALETPHDLVEVPIQTLDAVVEAADLARIDLIKIDVQGYECKVLAGMHKVLARHSPPLIFEYDAWAWQKADATLAHVTDLLQAQGYTLWWITVGGPLAPVDMQVIPAGGDLLAIKPNDPRRDSLPFII